MVRSVSVFICPVAIVYSIGQIIHSVCLCYSLCLSVYVHSRGRISSSIFAKSGTEVTTPKSKNEFTGGQPPLPLFYPQTAILGQKVLKIHADINMPISASLSVRISPEFPRHIGNRGRETRQ